MKMAPGHRFQPGGRFVKMVAAVGLACLFVLTGCSSTTGGGATAEKTLSDQTTDITVDSADPTLLAKTIRNAFLTDIPVKNLDPLVADTLAVASSPLSSENEALFKTCLKQPICDTGHGSLKVGIPIFATANAYNNVNRAEATAQLLAYPEVKEIHYSISNGDIAAAISNMKNLITQDVDIIVADLSIGAALNAVVQEAKDAGIVVVNVVTPLPAATKPLVTIDIPSGLCETFTSGIDALIAKHPRPSTYMMFTGIPGNDNAAAWQPCAKKALDEAGWIALSPAFTNWTSQGESQAANALRASGAKPGVILYDYSADKLVEPFIDAGETPPAVISNVSTYSWLSTVQKADRAGITIDSWIANGHVWFARLGVTAAIQRLHGKQVPQEQTMNLPMNSTAEAMSTDWQKIPADSVISSLLTNEQISLALAAN